MSAQSATLRRPAAAPPAVYARDNWLHPVLVALLYMSMGLTFVAAGWTAEGSGVFLAVCVGAASCGLLMAYARLSAFHMAVFGLLAGLCWTILLVSWQFTEDSVRGLVLQGFSLTQSRAYLLWEAWRDWLFQALQWEPAGNPATFLVNLSFYLWWICYFGAWTLLRYGQSWRMLFIAGVVNGVNAYYAPEPVNGLFIFFLFVAVLILISSHLLSLQWRWQDARVRFSPDILLDFMQSGLLFGVLVVGGAWALPRLGISPALQDLLNPASQIWEEVTDRTASWNQGLNQRQLPGQGVFGDSLTLGGARSSSDVAVMRVQAGSARYWRANVYDEFDGRSWRNTVDQRASLQSGVSVAATPYKSRTRLVQEITPQQDLGYVVLAAAAIERLTLPVTVSYETLAAGPDGSEPEEEGDIDALEILHAQTQAPLLADQSYRVLSSGTRATVWELANANVLYPPAVLERYLQVPESVPPRVGELAVALTDNADTVHAKAKAVENYLRRFPYAEDIGAAPPGQDPISYFLFELQSGYCDYYASSMVIMLRLLGIPARLAAGYAEGEFRPETQDYLVRREDAHSWVEVYFPEYGWIEFEPTAGESELQREAGGPPQESSAGGADSGAAASAGDTDDPDPFADDLSAFPEGDLNEAFNPGLAPSQGNAVSGGAWTLALAALGLALCGGLFWLYRRTRGLREVAVVRTYHGLMRWGESLDIPLQACDTPLERGRTLADALPRLAAECRIICAAYARRLYGGSSNRRQELEDSMQAESAWSAVRRVLWVRLLWRSLHRWAARPQPGPLDYSGTTRQPER